MKLQKIKAELQVLLKVVERLNYLSIGNTPLDRVAGQLRDSILKATETAALECHKIKEGR